MTESVPTGREHREALGATIRAHRHARGLTLRGLGELIGVSAATLSGIETGKTGVSSERATRLAGALDVSVERLFDGAPAYAPPTRVLPGASGGHAGTGSGTWRAFPPLEMDAALTGALSSFVEYGYHGASMRTIAERSGLSVPGLYHYYASKQEMLIALLDLTMTDLRTRTEAAMREGNGAVERFVNMVECLALVHTHRRDLAFVGASEMRSLVPAERARVAALRVDEQRLVDSAVLDGVDAGFFHTDRPHEASRAVVTMCTALAQWFRPDGPASAEAVARLHVEFALAVVRYRR